MDDNFREMGVGDLKVPKEMRRIGGGVLRPRQGLRRRRSTAATPAALEAALARNVFGGAEPLLGARRLAAYMREAAARLAGVADGAWTSRSRCSRIPRRSRRKDRQCGRQWIRHGRTTRVPTQKPAADKQPADAPPWSVPVVVAEVPETGRHVELVADDATRAAIAKAAGLLALPRLEAAFDLTRHGADGLRVAGRVSATVVQNCVVTLEPIESEIDEAVDLVFLPPEDAATGPRADAGRGRLGSCRPRIRPKRCTMARSISARWRSSFCCWGSIPIRASRARCSTRRRPATRQRIRSRRWRR